MTKPLVERLRQNDVNDADSREAADEIERLAKELKIAELKNRSSLANNLCPDHRDKQAGKSCLACEVERLQTIIDTHANRECFTGPVTDLVQPDECDEGEIDVGNGKIWKVRIEGDVCQVFDDRGNERHRSLGHMMTGVHLAMFVERELSELMKDAAT